MSRAVLIGLDWGTTNVRAALLTADATVLEHRRAESGVGVLDEAGFAARFAELVAGWPELLAIACGMVGSRQGWREAGYIACPASLGALQAGITRFETAGRKLAIVPGVKVDTEDRSDVMRGEETQIAGLVALGYGRSGSIILPGSHCKWARLSGQTVMNFRTYMTGELHAALRKHTILRHSIVKGSNETGRSFNRAALLEGAREALTAPGSDMGRFFSIRARLLLKGTDDIDAAEHLSGLLIGMEFAAAAADGFDIQDLVIAGESHLVERYAAVAGLVDAKVMKTSSDELVWTALTNLACDIDQERS